MEIIEEFHYLDVNLFTYLYIYIIISKFYLQYIIQNLIYFFNWLKIMLDVRKYITAFWTNSHSLWILWPLWIYFCDQWHFLRFCVVFIPILKPYFWMFIIVKIVCTLLQHKKKNQTNKKKIQKNQKKVSSKSRFFI